jgi:cytochrome P450 family 6
MIVTLAIITLLLLYVYIKRKYEFWKNRQFPYAVPKFIEGNIAGVGRTRSTAQALKDVYDEFREREDMVGIYLLTSPAVLLISPEMVKNILVRDFANFPDRGMYYNKKDDPLSATLVSYAGIHIINLSN